LVGLAASQASMRGKGGFSFSMFFMRKHIDTDRMLQRPLS
jgi:hypothetical protein